MPTSADGPLGVACLSVSAELGGSEWSLLDFASRASAHGIRPVVLLPRQGPLEGALRTAGVETTIVPAPESLLQLSQRAGWRGGTLPALVAGLRGWATAIRGAIASADADGPAIRLLYSNGFKAHLAGALVPRLKRVWHLREFPPGGVLQFVWRSLARVLPDGAIANSGATADAWAMMGARPVVVPNGVDLDRFRPSPKTYWLHDQLSLPHDVRLIGMPAVFARWKGHLLVIDAFERAAAELPDVHLVLVGGPIYDTDVERGYAEELVRRVRRSSLPGIPEPRPLTDRIHFVRHQSEPWRLYPEFDLVVHFSTRAEPFGRVVVEAMASGVPVVAARAGGPTEIIEDGLSGWLVPPGNVAALARCLVTVMGSEDRSAVGRAARLVVEQRFSADRCAAAVAAVLRGVGASSASGRG